MPVCVNLGGPYHVLAGNEPSLDSEMLFAKSQ